MLEMIDVAHEFGYRIAAFHHAVEAYKIAGVLASNGICADMWADWWGFKMEALDGIRENIAMVAHAGGCAVVHSDSAEGIQRLNQEAAKAMAAGNRAGIVTTPEEAIRWITLNPARSIGVDRQTGSLETGKMADVVVWSGNPFDVYSRAEKVYVDGALMYDRHDPRHQPVTDFELGLRDSPADQPAAAAQGNAGAAPGAPPRATAEPAPAASTEIVAITGATVHTMGPAGTLHGATVLIAGGRIQAVGAGVAVPSGARRIDAAGKVVTPGLLDSLTQLGLVEVSAVEDTEDATNEDPRVSAGFEVADGINWRSMLIPVNRVEGITRAISAPAT